MITLHHSEVVATHDGVLEVVLGEKLGPTVVGKVGTVVEEPLHGRWVLTLTWGRTGVVGVGADTVGTPDSEDGGSDFGIHGSRVVVLEVLDGRREVRKEPRGSTAGLAGAEKTYLIKEDVKTSGEGIESDGAGSIDKDEVLDLFTGVDELLRDFIGHDTTGGPSTNDVRTLRLAAFDLLKVQA